MNSPAEDGRTAGRGALILGLSQSGARALMAGFLIVGTRILEPSQFGRYSTVAAVLVVSGFISDFGTTPAITKLVSSGKDANTILSQSLSACFFLGMSAYAFGLLLCTLLGYSHQIRADFAILGLSLPFDACVTSVNGALDGSGLFYRRAKITFVRIGIGAVLATIALVLTGSIRVALLGLAGGSLVGLALAIATALRSRVLTSRPTLNPLPGLPLIRMGLPFAMTSSAGILYARFDVLVLARVASSATTAKYDIALRVVDVALTLRAVIDGPAMFLFAKRLSIRDYEGISRSFRSTAKILFVVSLPISAVMAVLGPQLVSLLFGDAYEGVGAPLAILSGHIFVLYVNGLLSVVISALPNMRPVVRMVVAMNIAGMILQLPFILLFHSAGAAAGFVIGQVLIVIAQASFLRRQIGIWLPIFPQARLLLAGAVCAAVAFALRDVPVVVAVLASFVAYGLVAIGTRVLGIEELRLARRLLGR